jgi:hypothetical protein
MAFTPTAENVVWFCSVVVQAATVTRLLQNGLYRTYRVLAAYLFLEPARFIAFLVLPSNWNAYAWLFLVSQPLKWLLEAAILVELCQLILQNHPGLLRLGRWVIGVSLTAAFLISAATAASGIAHQADQYKILFYYTAAERILDIAMVLFLVSMTAFVFWFPVAVNRNILVYFAGWACSFIVCSAAVIIPFATGHRITPRGSLPLEIISTICVLAWGILISQSGESSHKRSGYQWLPAHREKAQAQLEALNLVLYKTQRGKD